MEGRPGVLTGQISLFGRETAQAKSSDNLVTPEGLESGSASSG